MKSIEVLATHRVAGSEIEHAACVRAGDWIFLTGIEATDYINGLAPGVAPPPGLPFHGRPKHRCEADQIIGRMKAMLESAGSAIALAARVDQYYTTWKAVDSYHHARTAAFGEHIPPSTSIVMDALAGTDFDMSVSLIGVRAGAGLDPKRVSGDRLGAPTWSGFAPAVVCGDLVFIAGQMARAPDGSYDPRAHTSPHSLWGGYEIRRQAEHIIRESLLPALAAAGSSPGNALKAQAYVRHVEDIPQLLDVWNTHFGVREVALTVVPAVEFGHVSANLEINLIALRDGGDTHKIVVAADVPDACCFGAPAVRAGDLLFLSGLQAADGRGPVTGEPAASAYPHFHLGAAAQMQFLLEQASHICAAAGTSLQNVVRAQHFLVDLGDLPTVYRGWKQHAGLSQLPYSVVRTPSVQAVPQGRLTLDLWLHAA